MSTMTRGYAQTDAAWSRVLLGYNSSQPNNLGNLGCLVTAWGNMLWCITGDSVYTPIVVNQWMKDHNGFLSGGGTFIWSVALSMGHVQAAGTTSDLNSVNDFLGSNAANYAILQVTKPGFPMHFVFAPEVNQIIDSEDGMLKAMSTYNLVSAHLYRAIGVASQPVPQTTTPINEDLLPMTADQEKQAYEIVLGREPSGDDHVPTGRTALQFIQDAKGELEGSRQAQRDAITATQGQMDSLSAKLSSLEATNVNLTEELASSKAPSLQAPSDFRDTYKSLAHTIPMVTTASGVATDYAKIKPDQVVPTGMVFRDIAGTFLVNGTPMYRTQTSVNSGDWYGTPQSLFSTSKLSAAQSLHLGVSEMIGVTSRVEKDIKRLFVKGSK